jgi:hypothetical protein
MSIVNSRGEQIHPVGGNAILSVIDRQSRVKWRSVAALVLQREGWSLRQIGAGLGITKGSASRQIRRARLILAELIEADFSPASTLNDSDEWALEAAESTP